jgi:hypothetical protein
MRLSTILSVSAGALAVDDHTLLTRVPMIMTHDAGSGYLGKGLVNRWTQTQSVGLGEQLGCGARAIDARPMRQGNKTIWHHGGVGVDYEFSKSLADVRATAQTAARITCTRPPSRPPGSWLSACPPALVTRVSPPTVCR